MAVARVDADAGLRVSTQIAEGELSSMSNMHQASRP
jgi:hypothetical protein